MIEWTKNQLGELIEVKYGKDHKKLDEGKIPCFGSGGIMRFVDNSLYDKESILIPRKGSLNNIYYVDKPFWTVDTLFWSKINIEKVEPKFLFYNLKLIDFEGLNVGSAVPSLTTPVINEIEVNLPSLEEQKAIASVLSSLDDKIDLLHRQNGTLEKMAETLFRKWFVEDAKEDWEEKKLSDIVDFVVDNRGKTPPIVDYKTDFPLIEVNALNSNTCIVDYTAIRKYVTKETFDTWFRKYLKLGDVIISTVGTIGVFSIHLFERGCIAQNLVGIRSSKVSSYFIYNYLKVNTEQILTLDIGGVQPSIKVPNLLGLPIKLPSNDKLNEYHNLVTEFYAKIKHNYEEIETITKLRDTLLPKLMSGEVRVNLN